MNRRGVIMTPPIFKTGRLLKLVGTVQICTFRIYDPLILVGFAFWGASGHASPKHDYFGEDLLQLLVCKYVHHNQASQVSLNIAKLLAKIPMSGTACTYSYVIFSPQIGGHVGGNVPSPKRRSRPLKGKPKYRLDCRVPHKWGRICSF